MVATTTKSNRRPHRFQSSTIFHRTNPIRRANDIRVFHGAQDHESLFVAL
jgi:hypothetical protein